MKKSIVAFLSVCALAAICVADVTQKSSYEVTDGGRPNAVKDLVVTDIPAILAVLNDLDQLDGFQILTGTATNAETEVFSTAFSAAPVVLINSGNGTNQAYASAVTTTNFVANMKAGETNKWIAIGQK
jgi:hypothetical protein